MRTSLCILTFCFAASLAAAQTHSSDNPATEFTNSVWLYDSFTQGRIVFRDGTVAKARLNYNYEFGVVEYINEKKDTLAVADETDIQSVAINADTFFYDQQYLQLLAGNAQVKLAKHSMLKLTDTKHTGAFGTTTESPGVTYYSTIGRDEGSIQLKDPRGRVYKKVITYYMGDEYNHFVQLTKKNLLKRYNKDKETVNVFLDKNLTDFSKEEDLKELVVYLQTLPKS